jgi:hypothetical protein
MSFKTTHIILDRTNYEEAFLLYVDGELSAEQMNAVEGFVALHTDLQEELDALLTTKLDSEAVSFDHKESLFSKNINTTIIDEPLLLFIDNELPPSEKKAIEQRIHSDKEYEKQYELLRATKLDAQETIVFANKKELYHITQPSVRPIFLLRIAVAVILVLSASVFWWVGNNNGSTNTAVVANTPVKINTPQNKEAVPGISSQKEDLVKETVAPSIKIIKETSEVAQLPKKVTAPSNSKQPYKQQDKIAEQPLAITEPDPRNRIIAAIEVPVIIDENSRINGVAKNPSQQIINTPAVTTIVAEPYNNQKGATNETGVIYASQNSNDKQGSLRGFLRKATRFIERRTGINPVNEDDKLLIGVVAIKL